LVIDNGSAPFFAELLFRYSRKLPNVRIIPTKRNRYFGEGNNLAIDQSVGDYVLLLNNDAVLGANTLNQLHAALLSDKTIGAIAPVLILPDYRIQEVGGAIFGSGQVVQKEKFSQLDDFHKAYQDTDRILDADYASAACIFLRRDVLKLVMGFDVVFEPFYYEDTDLCARIRAQGYRISVHLDAFAMHVENASTKELLGDGMMNLVARQQQKFANRWRGVFERLNRPATAEASARYKTSGSYEILTANDVTPGYTNKPIAWVYTPFDIRVGGGERYILSVGSALSDKYEVWLLTQERTSRARLCMTMDDLAIRPGRFHTTTLERTSNWCRPDLYVVMGNEVEPSTPGYGKRNFYHCQYPFPIHHTGHFSIERILP
jgi:GT2 family glycosyltransferase